MDNLQWLVVGFELTRGWKSSEVRSVLAKLEPTDFAYGRARNLWIACQSDNAEAVRKQLEVLGVRIADGQRCLEAVVAAVRNDGDRRRRRELADRLAIAARLDP